MSTFSGEYLGFSLGGIHSSSLNIVRVSNGDRYTEQLSPNFQDSTAVIPGGVGTYYWKTTFTQLPITIDFAFDDLKIEDITRLKQLFNFNGVQELIFDEFNDRKYMVKCSSPPNIKFIPFSDVGDTMNYKGEGTINLVAFYPYAISTTETEILYSSVSSGSNSTTIQNGGDLDTPLKIYYAFDNNDIVDTIYCGLSGTNYKLETDVIEKNGNDIYVCVDMKTHLIEGMNSSYKKTGNLYNNYIKEGDFFLLPPGNNSFVWLSGNAGSNWTKIQFRELFY